MLFSDVEIINCTLATANNYLHSALNAVNSLVFAECNRLYEVLLDSWSEQVEQAHKVRFGF